MGTVGNAGELRLATPLERRPAEDGLARDGAVALSLVHLPVWVPRNGSRVARGHALKLRRAAVEGPRDRNLVAVSVIIRSLVAVASSRRAGPDD